MLLLSSVVSALGALITFSVLRSTLAFPLADKLDRLSLGARDLLKRSTPAAPHFVAYNDAWVYPFPSADQLKGYNVYILSFWMTFGPQDMAQGWQELTDGQRSSYLKEYNDAGISLIVSAFGSTDAPTSANMNPITIADKLASWVLQYGLQGVDVDYEDFNAFESIEGKAEPWLISLTQQLRKHLPQGEYILTHAPVAPWFSPNMWHGGGYLHVYQTVGGLIDWFHIQFYNQGITEYATCHGLLTASSSQWPESALFQIAANGVDKNKLVIGKPGTSGDANNGYMTPSTIAGCVAEAHSRGWDAGIMVWEYPHVGSSWIIAARGDTWPLSGSPPPVTPPPTPTTTEARTSTTQTPSTTSSGSQTHSPTHTASGTGKCNGVSAWVGNIAYTSGNKVSYNGHIWVANQWSYDEAPGGSEQAWDDEGACT